MCKTTTTIDSNKKQTSLNCWSFRIFNDTFRSFSSSFFFYFAYSPNISFFYYCFISAGIAYFVSYLKCQDHNNKNQNYVQYNMKRSIHAHIDMHTSQTKLLTGECCACSRWLWPHTQWLDPFNKQQQQQPYKTKNIMKMNRNFWT